MKKCLKVLTVSTAWFLVAAYSHVVGVFGFPLAIYLIERGDKTL